MKKVICILSILALWGCKQTEDLLTTQQNSTVRYLESSHNPRLMSEEAARESLDENPEYYTVFDRATYRYIATMYDAGRDSRTLIEKGDIAEIYFDAYIFNYSPLTNIAPVWSNKASTIAALEQTGGGLNPEYWSTDPMTLKAGSDGLEGLRKALVGCREGDVVEVYMTYAAAYGSGIVGLVPKESPVAWYFTVERVIKQ